MSFDFINNNQSSFPKPLENIEISFHSGCFEGLIEKELARVIEKLDCDNRIVIFKNKHARFALQVEIIQSDDYNKQAIHYQKEHPEKLVILFLVDEESWQYKEVIEKILVLNSCPITIIHMLNYFSNLRIDPKFNQLASDILEIIATNKHAQYSSRNSFINPKETLRTTSLKKGIKLSITRKRI